MEIGFSKKYLREEKKFVKMDVKRTERIFKSLNLFRVNPTHPSLNIEKISNKVWTVRLDKGNRIFFELVNKDTVLLIDIGKHDKYRKY